MKKTVILIAFLLALVMVFSALALPAALAANDSVLQHMEAEEAAISGSPTQRTGGDNVTTIWGLDYGNTSIGFTVEAQDAGERILSIACVCFDIRPVLVKVNGQEAGTVNCIATGTWGEGDGTHSEAVTIPVYLNAGTNQVVITGKPDAYGPGVDYIEVAPLTDAARNAAPGKVEEAIQHQLPALEVVQQIPALDEMTRGDLEIVQQVMFVKGLYDGLSEAQKVQVNSALVKLLDDVYAAAPHEIPDASELQIRVSCIGDSITDGIGASSASTNYPAQLQSLLGEHYVVGNYGVSGYKVLYSEPEAYRRSNRYYQSLESSPDLVIIMLGTNDAVVSGITTEEKQAEFRKDYQDLINDYVNLASHPKVMLALPLVSVDGSNARDGRCQNNEQYLIPIIRSLAEENHLQVLDMHAFTASWNRNNYLGDGLHPNDAGYAQLSREFAKYVVGSFGQVTVDGQALNVADAQYTNGTLAYTIPAPLEEQASLPKIAVAANSDISKRVKFTLEQMSEENFQAAVTVKNALGDTLATYTVTYAQNGDAPVRYEAEDGFLIGSAQVYNAATENLPVSTWSGGAWVGSLGNGDAAVQLNVTAQHTGKHLVEISYIAMMTRNLQIKVDGSLAATVECPGNGDNWNRTVSTVQVSLNLHAGENLLELGNTGDWAPNLDCIDVYPIAEEEIAAAVQAVMDAIAALPAADSLTLADEAAVQAAADLLAQLDGDQQALVANADKLVKAQQALQKLKEDARQDQEKLDKEAAAAVDAQIAALGEITSLEQKNAVDKARAAYAVLTDQQKQLVEQLGTLEAAEAAIKALEEAEKFTLGDLNGDGKLTVTDVVLLRKAILAGDSVEKIPAGNMNGDDQLTVTDVVLLRKAILNQA